MATISNMCFNNIKALIWSNDHCDPHVHFICDSEDWEVSIFFTFESSQNTPLAYELCDKRKGRPGRKQFQTMMENVLNHINDAKSQWWMNMANICVCNKQGDIDQNGKFSLVSKQSNITKTLETGRVCSQGFTMIKPYGQNEIKVL